MHTCLLVIGGVWMFAGKAWWCLVVASTAMKETMLYRTTDKIHRICGLLCSTDCMHYPVKQNWFMQQLQYMHRARTMCAPGPVFPRGLH